MNIQMDAANTRRAQQNAAQEATTARIAALEALVEELQAANAANIEGLWNSAITIAASEDIALARQVRDQYETANPHKLA